MPHADPSRPSLVSWPTFPFEGDIRLRALEPLAEEPGRAGDDPEECVACGAPDEDYIWVSDRWRVKATKTAPALPVVLLLETRPHLDLGDLPNLLAAELGVMTVRLERAIRSLPGVGRVHVNRWGDGAAHVHVWFYARPAGRLQLRGAMLPLWNEVLPPIGDEEWRTNLALVAAWLADFGGRAVAEPERIEWQAPSDLGSGSIDLSAWLNPESTVDSGEAGPEAGAPEPDRA